MDSHAPNLQISLMESPGEWRARVLVVAPGCEELKDVNEWRGLYSRLMNDPSELSHVGVLKSSKTGRVLRVEWTVADTTVDIVCKQSVARGGVRRFISRWVPSRQRRDWDRAIALIQAKIPTPRPIALVEPLAKSREAWLISTFLDNAMDLDRIVLTELSPSRALAVKRALMPPIIDTFARLEECGLHHRDLKASNLLVTDWDGSGRVPCVWLADLEGLRRARFGRRRKQWQPLVRLAASLVQYSSVSRTDFARFLRGYLKRVGIEDCRWRECMRRLAPRVAGYVRKSRKRKSGKLDGYAG